jgi:oligopeptide/dipeptide ABC transporter ATP-binding protein
LTKGTSAFTVYKEFANLLKPMAHYNIFMRQIARIWPEGDGVAVMLRSVNGLIRWSYKRTYALEGTRSEMHGFKSGLRREMQRIKRELKGKVSDDEICELGNDVPGLCELAKKHGIVIGDTLSLNETVHGYEMRILRGEIPEKVSRRWFKTLHRYMLAQMTVTALGESLKMLKLVNVPHPDKILEMYPFELSGGMQQRAMIAMALSCNPMLLIADEPSTALDVTIQAQILELMKDLKRRIGTSILLITHDLGVVAEMCMRVGVMYGGAIVEEGNADEIFYEEKHPYTMGLISSIPTIEKKNARLSIIPGSVPNLIKPPSGCRFHPRCPHAMEGCTKHKPPDTWLTKTHRVACFLYGEGLPVEERKHLKSAAEEEKMEVKAQ